MLDGMHDIANVIFDRNYDGFLFYFFEIPNGMCDII